VIDLLAPALEADSLRGVELVTVPCAARRLRVSTRTIMALVSDGQIAGVRAAGRLRIAEPSLHVLLAEALVRRVPEVMA
jgi:excisionase family DNA binding protein